MLANHLPFFGVTKRVTYQVRKGPKTHTASETLAETLAQLFKAKSNKVPHVPHDHQIHIAQTIRQHTCEAPEGGTNTTIRMRHRDYTCDQIR